jgi:two-component system alkaline phosphatase synthesis response regulator PhoP
MRAVHSVGPTRSGVTSRPLRPDRLRQAYAGTLGGLARIYLFEDDASVRLLLIEMLQDELGVDAVACATLSELKRLCAEQRPDLIVADFWGTSHLKLDDHDRSEISELAAIAPLVMVSARSWMLDAGAEELGVAALVPKPLDIERFASVVRDTLADATRTLMAENEVGELPDRESMSVFVLGWPAG